MERTLVILKPDAVTRGLLGEITSRFERKGLRLIGCKMMALDKEVLAEHYAHLADKPFFPGIEQFMQRTPVIVQCWEGVQAVAVVRELVGATNGREAAVGSIRGDLSMSVQANLVHASDSVESAAAETARFFTVDELHGYQFALAPYINAPDEVG